MALEYEVKMDLSEIDKFKQLLEEVAELREMVPDYLSYKADERVERIMELSRDCYYFKQKN